MCNTCGSSQGPFYKTFQPLTGKALRACGPIQFEKETGRLIGRVVECNKRRAKLEDEWYGKQGYDIAMYQLDK